ncbi:DUF222 domain-containing protein [Mycobacterium sp. URHB0044]|uniref:DUF222 domain-containing protein n=1 Tax=Mycobacterium sp. URHB0044 TaxID=1380386 RepID=UPI00351023BD
MSDDRGAGDALTVPWEGERAERIGMARRLIAVGRHCRRRLTESGQGRGLWCIDEWEAIVAEVGAQLGISRGRASLQMNYGLTLLERLPKFAAVCLAGDVDLWMLVVIEFRTALITDGDVLARIDQRLAEQVPQWSALSQKKVAELVDWHVGELDPEAVRKARRADIDRHIEVGPAVNGDGRGVGSAAGDERRRLRHDARRPREFGVPRRSPHQDATPGRRHRRPQQPGDEPGLRVWDAKLPRW